MDDQTRDLVRLSIFFSNRSGGRLGCCTPQTRVRTAVFHDPGRLSVSYRPTRAVQRRIARSALRRYQFIVDGPLWQRAAHRIETGWTSRVARQQRISRGVAGTEAVGQPGSSSVGLVASILTLSFEAYYDNRFATLFSPETELMVGASFPTDPPVLGAG